jgi:hypothetical protein
MSAYARHQTAVARSLSWAQAAADAGDYRDALDWLDTVSRVVPELPPGWDARRREWEHALHRRHARDDAEPGRARRVGP